MDDDKIRALMNRAIDEMRKSKPEHMDKPDPKVGAVLADENGNIIDAAHRGELRKGDHAEYTLLDKKHRANDVNGKILFATLEPCTSRKHPKVSCADRIINAGISKVYVGMPDPNPEIHGKGISHLFNNGVDVDFFFRDLADIVMAENREFSEYFLKNNAEMRLEATAQEDSPSAFENTLVTSAELADFSPDLVKIYLEKKGVDYPTPSDELWKYFGKRGFLYFDENKKRYIPTAIGVLLFSKEPETFFSQMIIKIEIRYGTIVRLEEISGSLLKMPSILQSFIEENVRKYSVITSFQRVEKPQYPLEAIREAVINALAHRDYSEGRRIHVLMTEDEFIVRSPGLPLKPLTLEKIRKYQIAPYSRNPKIAAILSEFGYMEERGHGLIKMRDLLKENGLAPPSFDFNDGYFVVNFRSQGFSGKKVTIADELYIKLSGRQKTLVTDLLEKGSISTKEYMQLHRISRPTALKDLKVLIDLGIIESRGKANNLKYFLIIDEDKSDY